MRPDLAKCTTERPRSGGSLASCYKLKFGGRVPVHPDREHDYPNEHGGFKSSARHRHYESKNFTDALGALRGNIRKNVGRPWDKVYSEFCRFLDRRSLSGYHIWQHLMWEVELNTYLHNGVVYKRGRYGTDYPVDGHYVHPATGVLEYKNPGSWKWNLRRKPKVAMIPVPEAPGWNYQEIDGLWFRTRTIEVVAYGCKTVKTEKKSANRKEIAWIKERLKP
jgi:hypothetical protein